MSIVDDSSEILGQIRDIYSLLLCLLNSARYSISCGDSNFSYLSILIEIIDDKFKNLIADYDKFDVSLFNLES